MPIYWNMGAIDEAFMQAAIGSTSWETALDVVADQTESTGICILPVHGRNPFAPFSQRLAGVHEQYLREGWVHKDERYLGEPQFNRVGVSRETDFTTIDVIKRHPYWQDFLGAHGLRWWGGVKLAFGEDVWCLSIQRSIERGPFSDLETQQLAGLSHRVGSAGALAAALGFARADAALEAFEFSHTAVVLLDRFGAVLKLNASASALMGSDINITQGRLGSRIRSASAALDRALHGVLWKSPGPALCPPIALPRQGKRPVLAYAARLPSITTHAMAPCQAAVVLIDLETKVHSSAQQLQVIFGLSPAEGRLAVGLAEGADLATAADKMGITKETARGQLKSIFVKTDTHRQSELIALLAKVSGGPLLPSKQ